jgi:DNA-3-methyladenine glycosylase
VLQPNSSEYAWLELDSLVVAPQLLGWELVSIAGGTPTTGRIVEVEAYHGASDPASHAYRGLTRRTTPMFEAGGAIYVYQSYGVHACVNIVTGPAGKGQAVLIRALEPTIGLPAMTTRRNNANPRLLTTGPGRVSQALGITLDLSGGRLGTTLSLRPPAIRTPPGDIVATPRIGISKATQLKWRFYLKNNLSVSRPLGSIASVRQQTALATPPEGVSS